MRQPSRLPSSLLVTAVLAVLSLSALGCSSGKKASTTATVATTTTAVASATTATTTAAVTTAPTAATASTASTAAAAGGLSGTWSGQYSGSFQGTFTLTWQQSGSVLSGNIKLTSPPVTLDINGTVQGGAIRFGTVGSVGITYSGSASGNSLSGTYQVQNGTGSSGGPWSATRSS